MDKKVLVVLTRPPAGRIHVIEGTRIAVGLTLVDLPVNLVLTGDSVFAARKEFKDRLIIKYFNEFEGQIHVDSEALTRRGINKEDLRNGVEVINTSKLARLVENSELVLTF